MLLHVRTWEKAYLLPFKKESMNMNIFLLSNFSAYNLQLNFSSLGCNGNQLFAHFIRGEMIPVNRALRIHFWIHQVESYPR